MTIQEAIEQRVSRRSYQPVSLRAQEAAPLQAAIANINAQQRLHIQLVLDGAAPFAGLKRSYGLLTGVSSYFALVASPLDIHYREKLGFFGEELVLLATQMGLGTCWVGGSYSKNEALCELREGEKLDCVICVGYAGEKTGLRERVIRGVTHRKSKTVAQMSETEGPVPQWFVRGMQSVQRAPSARNGQPVVFRCINGAVTAAVPGGGSPVDLGIAKLHFQLGAGLGRWDWGQGAAFYPQG